MIKEPVGGFNPAEVGAEIAAIDAEFKIDTEAFDRLLEATPVDLHHTLVVPLLSSKVGTLAPSRPVIN